MQVLATNKLASVCGTTVSSVTYYRRVKPHAGTFVPLMVFAFVGSVLGALIASRSLRRRSTRSCSSSSWSSVPTSCSAPQLGETTELRFSGRAHRGAAMATGFAIGVYDGALGPGTGSFFVFTLVGLLGYSFLEASAKARMANWATNVAALCVFVPQGAVLWGTGLVMGLSTSPAATSAPAPRSPGAQASCGCSSSSSCPAFIVRIGGEVLGLWG